MSWFHAKLNDLSGSGESLDSVGFDR